MVKLVALAFGLLSIVGQVSAQQTVKVMPFGASIVSRCWRANLQAKLKNDKATNFDFVGTQTSACGGNGVDQNHEGHPGSQATDYAKNGNLTVWLNANPPDVVLMLLGTNDVLLGKRSTGDILKAYDVLIGQMRTKNPKMRIVFSNLLPLDPKRWPQSAADGIVNLNAAIKQYAPSKNTRESPVVFVDNFSDFDPVQDTTDGEHPNDKGNEKMATKFFAPTRDAIKAIAPIANGPDPAANRQAMAQGQGATPTIMVSSVKATGQAQSTSAVAAVSQTSFTSQNQATGSATPEAKTTTPSGSQHTSSASSLRTPWALSIWKVIMPAVYKEGSLQHVLSK